MKIIKYDIGAHQLCSAFGGNYVNLKNYVFYVSMWLKNKYKL